MSKISKQKYQNKVLLPLNNLKSEFASLADPFYGMPSCQDSISLTVSLSVLILMLLTGKKISLLLE